jgi:hypothetical protein
MIEVSIDRDGRDVPVSYFVDAETLAAVLAPVLKEYGKVLIKDKAVSVKFSEDEEVVKVYFESGCHAEVMAYVLGDSVYSGMVDNFSKLARKGRMRVTESVLYTGETDEWREPLWCSIKEKQDAEKASGKNFWFKKEQKNEEKRG